MMELALAAHHSINRGMTNSSGAIEACGAARAANPPALSHVVFPSGAAVTAAACCPAGALIGSRMHESSRRWIAAATAILLCAGHAAAQSDPLSKYPGPHCGLPEFEVLPQAEDAKTPDKTKANLYDYEVRQYNREVEAYGACIRNYVAKANSDAERIQAQANDDAKRITDNANASVAVIQAQIRKATANARKISNTPASALVGK